MAKRITLSFTWYVMTISMALILILFVGMGFAGYKLYKRVVAAENAQKAIVEAQTQERLALEKKSEEILQSQTYELEQAKLELTKTKSEAAKTNDQVKTLSKTLQEQAKAPKEIIISSADLAPYANGVVQVICSTPAGISSGSGSLWNFSEVPYAVVTNYHVVKGADKCAISITNSANTTIGMFALEGEILTFNQTTDEAILTIGKGISSTNVPVANYNYSLANLRKCPNSMPVGTPVVIMGFPAYAKRDSTITITSIGTVNAVYRATTNGIISGYDTSQKGEPNYFVSAKIDNGNSGGMAIAKDTSGLCVLGLPTWLTVGNYETQGLVQNILNILP